MEITLLEVIYIIDDLIYQKKTREEIAQWARNMLIAHNQGKLKFLPHKEKSRMLKAFVYLENAIERDKVNEYKYSSDRLLSFFRELDLLLPHKEKKYTITVTIDDIKNKFNDLINERKSRDEIYDWANERTVAGDDGALQYEPPGEKDKIWEALSYLVTTVVTTDLDGEYLYSKKDFLKEQSELQI